MFKNCTSSQDLFLQMNFAAITSLSASLGMHVCWMEGINSNVMLFLLFQCKLDSLSVHTTPGNNWIWCSSNMVLISSLEMAMVYLVLFQSLSNLGTRREPRFDRPVFDHPPLDGIANCQEELVADWLISGRQLYRKSTCSYGILNRVLSAGQYWHTIRIYLYFLWGLYYIRQHKNILPWKLNLLQFVYLSRPKMNLWIEVA